jgi:hypothetical protein
VYLGGCCIAGAIDWILSMTAMSHHQKARANPRSARRTTN